ncbi:MAG: DNA repair protein RecN [Rhodothermales bacterium]
MLRSLYVRDYALIEELRVEFDAGLNIITGETGAGKSILVGALQMILGERASTDTVRSGASKAVIEGVFGNADDPSIAAILDENAIDPQPVVILRREITTSYSRGFINDTPATLQVMREVASHLIDLHGQHEHQSLLDVSTHVGLLDSFGQLDEPRGTYAERYAKVAELTQARNRLRTRKRELEEKKELYGFQIEEIDRVNPQEGEEETLDGERRVLENAERLYDVSTRLYELLYDGNRSIHDQLVEVHNELREVVEIDAQFEETLKEIDSARIITSEAAAFLQDYGADVEFNPERLDEIRSRVSELERLKRKYGGTLDAVLEHRREIGEVYETAQNFDRELERLTGEIDAARESLSEAALQLSERRQEVAGRIEKAVEEECARLGMPDCRFRVTFDVDLREDGWIRLEDGRRAAAYEAGMDRVEFYISTNLGEEPRPLAKVASGGEISRIMLALKSILAKSEQFPILVFDEIDVGISGAVAGKVGRAMHELASSHQIIAITHLPQIAARGDVHFLVEKHVEDGRTKTRIRRLSDQMRAEHVASLMSGAEITDAALKSARELMERR